MRTCLTIVLAAGEGTRMRASRPKVLHAIGGRPLIAHVLAAGQKHGKACGLLVADGAAAARRLEQGWSFVGIGSDSTLLAAAVTAEFGQARTAIKPEPE